MADEAPEYLHAFGPAKSGLRGIGDSDLPGFKPKREESDTQLSQLILPMPKEQLRPLGGKGPDVEWLLSGTPRPVQVEALRRSYYGYWMKQGEDDPNEIGYRVADPGGLGRTGPGRGWAHFMEQRLGKTPVLLNEFGLLSRDYDCKFGVVVAPQQFKPEWADEADRFRLDRPTHVFNSGNRADAQRWVDRNRKFGGLIAVNYEALLSDDTRAFLAELAPGGLIAFDESVSIKGDGKLSMKALELAKLFRWRRDLTGKPVVQGPHDLYMQLRMIGGLNGVNPVGFKKRYCKMGGFQGKQILGVADDKVEELHSILTAQSFMARRVNWLKTPGSENVPARRIPMLDGQAKIYKRMEEDFIIELDREGFDPLVIGADQIVTKLLKLQQIASGFVHDEWGTAHDLMPPSMNPKLQATVAMLRQEIDHKVIIFAHYKHSIRLLREALKEFNPACIVGDGQAKEFKIDVQVEKRRFNADRTCRVMIGQKQAIRYGHTLMGSPDDPCLSEIFYENNYSLNDRSQCEERPQGAGQVGQISIYDFACAPIEAQIIEALQRKEDVSSVVMNYARSTGVLPR